VIAVEDRSIEAAPGPLRGGEGVGDQAGAHVVGDRPAREGPGVQIDHGGQVEEPALADGQIRDGTDVTLVDRGGGEVPPSRRRIRSGVLTAAGSGMVVCTRRRSRSPRIRCRRITRATLLTVDRQSFVVQLGGDPRRAVGAVVPGPHRLDPHGQSSVRGFARRPCGRNRFPVVETRAGDPDELAQPLHAVARLVVGDELEAGHQRVSPAKYRAALRRMSRSSSNSRTRRRSAAFSSSTVPASCGPPPSAGRPVSPRRWSSSRTQLRSVSRLTPRSSAICAIVAPGRNRYNAAASALNSAG